ncbi:hypothetical protein [Thermoproteus tenax]|uniref:Uncharacterized protein n=1 Tax=Thermoproteus tenax (strain ATCC 35583 / DSM 2078 / JCM 9277 / NBRC 100435 / Kra 1) TaxID=768679 RepID=G4RN95_THETK|nr:hypothetical protein [Thermoproteus tenax]CCC81039.1 hypothetical protein TTX_0364 [Thermoproteus tenax Kra 1]
MNARLVGAALIADALLIALEYAAVPAVAHLPTYALDLLRSLFALAVVTLDIIMAVGALIGEASVPTALGAVLLSISGLFVIEISSLSRLLPPGASPSLPLAAIALNSVLVLVGWALVALGLTLWYRRLVPALFGLLMVTGVALTSLELLAFVARPTSSVLSTIGRIQTVALAVMAVGRAGLGIYTYLNPRR